MSKITSSILIIGNEVLSGRTQDINVQFIAKELSKLGINLSEVRIVPDNKKEIVINLNQLRKKHDYVFTTGGIGPTHDDITSESISEAFNVEYSINSEAYNILKNFYPEGELNEGRIKMTKMPKGARLIKNPLTVAPGFYIENVYALPGVPKIMQTMFPSIINNLNISDPIISETVHTNLFESIIAKSLEEIQNKFNDCEIGSYPNFDYKSNIGGIGGVNIVISGKNILSVKKAKDEVINIIKKMGGK
tara:strand:+ start:328 stop:1071 length:744 start_codon:yes stop_codon:yes gene_type:complete